MPVARDDLGRAARKRGIEGQVTINRHFGIRCIWQPFRVGLHVRYTFNTRATHAGTVT